MAFPVAAVDCQLYYGQRFDGVPWLKNCRLHARFNLLILTHMSVINVLNCPATVVSSQSVTSGLMSWNRLCMCWILEESFLWCFKNFKGNLGACSEELLNPVNIVGKDVSFTRIWNSWWCFGFGCVLWMFQILQSLHNRKVAYLKLSTKHQALKAADFFLLPIFLLWISPSHIFPSRPSLFVLKKRPHGTV